MILDMTGQQVSPEKKGQPLFVVIAACEAPNKPTMETWTPAGQVIYAAVTFEAWDTPDGDRYFKRTRPVPDKLNPREQIWFRRALIPLPGVLSPVLPFGRVPGPKPSE